jgi:hypothetical protein
MLRLYRSLQFGRRVEENSGGTDHGTAAPMLIFGPALNDNGVLGDNPSLTNLDQNGNLKNEIDFRSVYATILESWLCVDAIEVDAILGASHNRIEGLGIECLDTAVVNLKSLKQNISHFTRYNDDGSISINYTLSRPGEVKIEIFSYMGHHLDTLTNEYKLPGEHTSLFFKNKYGWSTGVYVHRINSGTQYVCGKIICN